MKLIITILFFLVFIGCSYPRHVVVNPTDVSSFKPTEWMIKHEPAITELEKNDIGHTLSPTWKE